MEGKDAPGTVDGERTAGVPGYRCPTTGLQCSCMSKDACVCNIYHQKVPLLLYRGILRQNRKTVLCLIKWPDYGTRRGIL